MVCENYSIFTYYVDKLEKLLVAQKHFHIARLSLGEILVFFKFFTSNPTAP